MRPLSLSLIVAWACSATLSVAEAAEPTYSKDVAPIIYKSCTKCHRPGEAAPFSLQTYADVKKRGELIDYAVTSKLMPPWKADVGDVAFRHERRLSEAEITLVSTWIKAGMPEGNRADLPAMPDFPHGWQLGAPDLVLKMPEAYTVPAEGPDVYRNFVVPTGLTEDRWVRAVEFRPGAPNVVHHSLFFLEANGVARSLDAADPEPGFRGGMGALGQLRGKNNGGRPLLGRFGREPEKRDGDPPANGPFGDLGFGSLGGWALGAQPRQLPDGLAFYLPAKSDVILSTHFHPSGKEEQEASTLGLYFADRPPEKRFTPIQLPTLFGAFKGIDIPAGEKNYVIEESFVLPVDVRAFGVGAHAHYLGKTMKLTAALPTGETKTLLSISDWDFAWQEQYEFADYVDLPKGTKLHARITYDNSAANPRNPTNPPVRVRFGEESTNEMGSITLTVVAAREPELAQLQTAYRDHFRESLRNAPWLKLIRNRRK